MTLPPVKPANLDPRAARLLGWMGEQPWANHIVLGGALALNHYVEYRTSHDCDAWWAGTATTPDRERILSAVAEALAGQNPGLETMRESWGDVGSVKLLEAGRAVFSFQIADRSRQLEPYLASGWGGLLIESLVDNLASKLSALVERGAPRDFLDVYTVAHRLGWTPAELWRLWQRKNPDKPAADAKLLIRVSLAGIERRRPLPTIVEPGLQAQAATVRDWFKRAFLSAT
jgi:hypothetical protein